MIIKSQSMRFVMTTMMDVENEWQTSNDGDMIDPDKPIIGLSATTAMRLFPVAAMETLKGLSSSARKSLCANGKAWSASSYD